MPPFDHFSFIAPIYARVAYSKTNLMRDFASLPVEGRLLDVGGGTGRVSSAIGDLVDEVIVADISFGMLKETSQSALKPVCGASERLPFADKSFERVVMVDALHHVHNQLDSTREMYRVLKPGGVLVIEEPDIRTFGVKIIAIAEKLLFMQSHFLEPIQIANLFLDGEQRVHSENGTAWVVIKKAGHAKA